MNKNLIGKKLLLLGGASQHRKVAEAAKEMGVFVVCTDPNLDSPTKEVVDKYYFYDVNDIDALIDLCQMQGVDGVLNVYLDPCQRPHQQICNKLNFPCFGNEIQFSIFSDKKKFKKYCIENGVGVVPEFNIPDFTDSDADDNDKEFPVLVKPVDSRGSRGQTICYNSSEIQEAIPVAQKESSNGEVLVEKYMGRDNDFMVSYLVVDGEPYLLRATDRYLGEREDGLEKVSIANISPSRFTDLYISNAHHHVKKMIKNLGIKNGPVFMQGFMDGKIVRFYDAGLRFPASEYEVSLKTICKIDVLKLLVEFALTGSILGDFEKLSNHVHLDGQFAVSLYPTIRAGIIHKIIGLEKIIQMDNVVAFSKRYIDGDQVFQSNNVTQRFCAVEIVAPSIYDLQESINLVQNQLRVLDNDGNNLIYGNFNSRRILKYEK